MALSAYAQMLTDQRNGVWEKAKALLDHAANEKRSLDSTEQASYDQMTKDLADLRSAIDKVVADEQAVVESEEALRKLANLPVDPARAPSPDDGVEDELRKFFAGETRSFATKGTKEDLRAIQTRALTKLTSAAGGATVPTSFYGRLWAHLIQTANLLNAGATILQTDSGEPMQVPVTTAHSQGALVGEAGVIPSSDPAFGQRQLSAFKYGVLVQLSSELISDTGVDLDGYVAMQAGRAVGNAMGTDLVVGNGTGKPLGITATTTLGVTGATGAGGAPSFDNLIDLYYSVIPQYRNSDACGWLFADATGATIRKLKDNTGRYLWEPALIAGQPDRILSKPVNTDPFVPGVGLGNKSVLFGDMSAYMARTVNGIRFERSDDFAFNQDLVTFRCLVRGDGMLIDQTGAVKHFIGAAS